MKEKRKRTASGLSRPARVLCSLLFALGLISCSDANTVDPLYYVIFPALAGAQDRPAQPSNLRGSYNQLLQQVELAWDSSAGTSDILLYRVYIFTDGPPASPEQLYRDRDRLAESGLTFAAFAQSPFSGSLFFLVTSYNGFSESLPSNVVDVNVFNGNF